MSDPLSTRLRLLRTWQNLPTDRLPDLEFGAWIQTIDRWGHEGLDLDACRGLIRPVNFLEKWFQTDDDGYGPGLALNLTLLPAFPETILEDRGQVMILQDRDGAVSEQLKPEFGASIPRYIRFAIQNRADWEQVKAERLDPESSDRVPPNLEELSERLRDADYPITVPAGSLYGYIRNWMGVENLSLMLYDDRALVEDMMEHLTRLTLHVLEKLAGKGFKIDFATWWEDMCYKAGSLLSPRLFREMMVPRYQRITRFLREEFGCQYNQLDCDGNIHQLISLWLEGGINVMWPMEAVVTDPFRVYSQFGTQVKMRGGFDKRALIAGPAAIDAEFEHLRPLIDQKALIPHTDHLVPPDVPYDHYLYYRKRKLEIIGKPWQEPGVRRRDGHIQTWRLLGPFDSPHNQGFHDILPPEANSAGPYPGKNMARLNWIEYRGSHPAGYVDLKRALSALPWSVAFAECSIFSPTGRKAWLELGSDDGIKVWMNGELLFSRDCYRAAALRQEMLLVNLNEGWNHFRLKISQAEGEWGFLFYLLDLSGHPLKDIEVKA